jgi:hypothetical protein
MLAEMLEEMVSVIEVTHSVMRLCLQENSEKHQHYGVGATGLRRWHLLHFFPLPHGHGSFLPILAIASMFVIKESSDLLGEMSIASRTICFACMSDAYFRI